MKARYTSLKVLIDYYKQNNRMLDELEPIEGTVEYDPNVLDFTQRLQERHHRFERSLKRVVYGEPIPILKIYFMQFMPGHDIPIRALLKLITPIGYDNVTRTGQFG